jgi:hypothetical protein
VEFDETNGSQEEEENLNDVRGTQLANAMKKMDVGDIRPREVIEVEDDKDQVFSNSKVQDQQKWLVHHLNQVINQMQVIKFKCSNLPILQEIIH